MRLVLIILLTALAAALPPRPGFSGPEPVFPPEYRSMGPNLLRDRDYCETVTILMQFPDNLADTIERSPARFDSMLYAVGVYNQGPYRQGSLNDYFIESSYGNYDVRGGIAGDRWFTSQYNYSRYYDGNYLISKGAQLARENIRQVDPHVDFREFDLDDDGYIDAMFMVHAGADGADNGDVNCLWSHAIPNFNYRTDDGVIIRGVTNVPEFAMVTPALDTTICCIAVMCHELGHLVGLPDLYDYSRRNWGVGYWGLMGYGAWGAGGNTPWSPSHMEAWSKVEAGFVEPITITENIRDLRIPPVQTNPVIYKVWQDGADHDTCFYLENRQQTGFDTPLPGPGLLIWRVDPAWGSTWYRRVDLQEDHTFHLDSGYGRRPDPHYYHPLLGADSDPLPGAWNRTAFNDTTIPNSRRRNGIPTNVNIANIRLEGDTIVCDVFINDDTTAVTELPLPGQPGPLAAAPNPFRNRVTVQTSDTDWQAAIYSVGGRLVREINGGFRERLEWDGTGPTGKRLPAGVYLLRLSSADSSARTRLIMLD